MDASEGLPQEKAVRASTGNGWGVSIKRIRNGTGSEAVALRLLVEDRRRRGYEFMEAAEFLVYASCEEKLGLRIALRDTAAVLRQMGQKLVASY